MANKISKPVLEAMGLKTQREFKQLKRRQLREVARAINAYRCGCFYCPGEFDIGGMARSVEKHQRELSVKEWGR